MQTVIFKDLPKVSANQIYAGKHWRYRQTLKKHYLLATHNTIKKLTPAKSKVDLSFTFNFTGNPLDSSNTFYMAKLIEDCLVHYKIIVDDEIKFVGEIACESHKTIDSFDSCELTMTERN